MDPATSSETFVSYRSTTKCHNPEDLNLIQVQNSCLKHFSVISMCYDPVNKLHVAEAFMRS
jgi:hypothetical protein